MGHRCNHCQATCTGYRARDPHPSPDIAQLLATNDAPASTQEEKFRGIRIDGVKRLTEIETIIEQLQQRLEGAMVERDELAWNLEHHDLVLNPVRRLPTDILLEIFVFSCARSTKDSSYFYLAPPTFLAAVCRSWNHIAITSPLLWRHCKRVFPFTYGKHRTFDCSVSRSAMCPLWLDLDMDCLHYPNPGSSLLVALCHRIQGIRIHTYDGHLDRGLPRAFIHGLTSLEFLDLRVTPTLKDVPDIRSFIAPSTMQHLVITPHATFSNPRISLNWHYLKRLVLRARWLGRMGTSADSTLRILGRMQHLQSLTFSDDWEHRDVRRETDELLAPDTSITMAHLTELAIECCTPSLCDVVANISVPSLDRLIIKAGSREVFAYVEDMLRKSGCTLLHLTLQSPETKRGSVDSIGTMGSLIRQCGGLRELSLLGIHASTPSITQLLSSLDSLSKLHVLALDICYIHDLGDATQIAITDVILAFLETRRKLADTCAASSVDLESMTLHAPCEGVFDLTQVQLRRIEALRADGLLFYICRYAEKDPRLY